MNVKRLSREAAYEALLHSDLRNQRRFAPDQPMPTMRRLGSKLLATYNTACRRKRAFVEESKEQEERLARIAAAVRLMTADSRFRALLASEGLATMPNALAQRIQAAPHPPSVVSEKVVPSCEVCPEALNLLRDCTGSAKLFALLRLVVPARQIEIARLIISMERPRFSYVKMLVALTPRPLLAKDIDLRKQIAGISKDEMAEMELELGRLSRAYLDAVERSGVAKLELVAAGRYFDRLMDNSKAVRYLARYFPGKFEEFHMLSANRDSDSMSGNSPAANGTFNGP
ncbi:plasmid partitioning protein RepB C-terminal domain-containing protein [Mesorhizobium sp. ArgA1]